MNAKRNRQLGIILSYISMALSFIIGMVYTPYALRKMGQSDYGNYQYISSLVNYLSLLTCGFGSAYLRFSTPYRRNGDKEGIESINGLFLTLFMVMGSIALVIGGIMVVNSDFILGGKLTADELATGKILMLILVVNLFLTFPISIFNSYIIAQEKFFFQKLLALISHLLNYGLSVVALALGHKSIGVTLAMLAVSIIVNTTTILFCILRLKMRFRFKLNNMSQVKEVFAFSSFILLSMVIDQINWSVDKFLLGKLCGTAVVSIYTVGATINTHYKSLGDAISNVYVPKVYKVLDRENPDWEATKLMTSIGRAQAIFLLLILSGFTIFGQAFIKLWVGPEYWQSYYVILLLLFPVTIPEIQKIGLEIQKAKNMHKFRSVIFAFIAGANLLISIPLCMKFEAIGAAIGTTITVLIGNGIIMNIYYHKKVNLDMIYFWKQICTLLPAVLTSVAVGVVLNLIIKPQTWLWLVVAIGIYVVVYLAAMLGFGFNKEERNTIMQKVGGIFRCLRKKSN